MSNLILGYGLLGKEIHKQTGWDFTKNIIDIESGYDLVINCIGHTNTYDNNREKHWYANVQIPKGLIEYCNEKNIKYVHISTDYIYSGSVNNASEEDVPVHNNCWYSYTKLLADGLVQLESNDYLICRGTHKPYPFTHEKAWISSTGYNG